MFEVPLIKGNRLTKYISVLNTFWDYKHDNELVNKIIFLEESFYVDNRGNKDLDIVQDILSFVKDKELRVKLHPRTRHNRFNDLGIRTYENTSVPCIQNYIGELIKNPLHLSTVMSIALST